MSTDHMRYDLLVQDALRGVVRKVLHDAGKNGLPGEHHFFVSFRTDAPGVRISAALRARYPEEMTIVLQHQFWDLGVTDHTFEVGLSFKGVPERLLVPFDALTSFVDPSVQFGLKFEQDAVGVAQQADGGTSPGSQALRNDDQPGVSAGSGELVKIGFSPTDPPSAQAGRLAPEATPKRKIKGSGSEPEILPAVKSGKARDAVQSIDNGKKPSGPDKPAPEGSAEVFSLDSFRKKK